MSEFLNRSLSGQERMGQFIQNAERKQCLDGLEAGGVCMCVTPYESTGALEPGHVLTDSRHWDA